MREIEKGIFTFEIPLPDNPLKWLNCYVIRGEGSERNLLIDSGFHRRECWEALLDGIRELALSPCNTDVLFTHLHSDHTGNGFELSRLGYKIMMGRRDYHRLFDSVPAWERRARRLGVPDGLLEKIVYQNPGLLYAPQKFETEFLNDGDRLSYGGRRLECILVPGHTPGNLCLYDAENRIMFTGDHILFDITPNIVSWLGFQDSLGAYLESLERIRKYDIRLALPAHRSCGSLTAAERITELQEHHRQRLGEILAAAERLPGADAYELAAQIRWNIHAESWEDFPPGQKWFAAGETQAHLEYLQLRGFLRMEEDESGTCRYYPKSAGKGIITTAEGRL